MWARLLELRKQRDREQTEANGTGPFWQLRTPGRDGDAAAQRWSESQVAGTATVGLSSRATGEGPAVGTAAVGTAQSFPAHIVRDFAYNAANRMSEVRHNGTVAMQYRYNGLGEQVLKFNTTRRIATVYDEDGRWIGDYDATTGQPLQQVIWLHDLPVGMLVGSGAAQKLYYIEPDALGTPRVVLDPATRRAVWRWDLIGEAFGDSAPNQDPDGDGQAFVFDMRFPGQRYDAATGMSYNYFRDYDPASGRYTQSDPIGLNGGISTFGYAGMTPMIAIDRDGLHPVLLNLARYAARKTSLGARAGAGKILRSKTGRYAALGAASKAALRARVEKEIKNAALKRVKPDCKGVAKDTADSRAKELHALLDPRAQRARTTAVTETREGMRVVSSSERRLTPAQRANLRANEIEGVGIGHAEVTGINYASRSGLNPTGAGTSRPICGECARFMAEHGIKPLSPLRP